MSTPTSQSISAASAMADLRDSLGQLLADAGLSGQLLADAGRTPTSLTTSCARHETMRGKIIVCGILDLA